MPNVFTGSCSLLAPYPPMLPQSHMLLHTPHLHTRHSSPLLALSLVRIARQAVVSMARQRWQLQKYDEVHKRSNYQLH